MQRVRSLVAAGAACVLISGATGCVATAQVGALGRRISRGRSEVVTAKSSTVDAAGTPFAVVALEAECRVTPGDAEGGPTAGGYLLARSQPTVDDEGFLKHNHLTLVRAYRSGSDDEHRAPEGFPDEVLLGEDHDGDAKLFLKLQDRWAELPIARYVHRESRKGSPVLGGVTVALLMVPAVICDLVTFPIQWIIVPAFDLTPKDS